MRLLRLQWGRDVSIPEIRMNEFDLVRFSFASMGPGCFHPRNARETTRLKSIVPCFNGAGMFPSQKWFPDTLPGAAVPKLQWGRDVSIPEIGNPAVGELIDKGIKDSSISGMETSR